MYLFLYFKSRIYLNLHYLIQQAIYYFIYLNQFMKKFVINIFAFGFILLRFINLMIIYCCSYVFIVILKVGFIKVR
jgi:hypothetical protein